MKERQKERKNVIKKKVRKNERIRVQNKEKQNGKA